MEEQTLKDILDALDAEKQKLFLGWIQEVKNPSVRNVPDYKPAPGMRGYNPGGDWPDGYRPGNR
jgi:hypothetical protein